jgi:uncharacterized protein
MRITTAVVGLLLAGCGGAGSGPALFVLGGSASPANTTTRQAGLPIVEVKPVQLPSYLDSTDLVVRGPGGQTVPSRTARWGERLSEGFTRALTADLAALLPRMALSSSPPVERPSRQLLVDVESFDATVDRGVVLVARWTVTDGAARSTLASERVSIAIPLADTGDAAVVAAMTRAVADLAGHVALALTSTRSPSGQRRSVARAHPIPLSRLTADHR